MMMIEKVASMIDMSTALDGMEYVRKLGEHGAKVVDTLTGEARDVDLNLFCDAIRFLHDEVAAISIDYDMRIPETDEKMLLRIWKNGHVDSGSHDAMMDLLNGRGI